MSLARFYSALLSVVKLYWKQPADYYFNCGGGNYTDPEGTLWAGLYAQYGNNYDYGPTASEVPLWSQVIYATSPFVVPLPAGSYLLTAYIKEVYVDSEGRRVSGLRVVGGPTIYEGVDGFIGPRFAPDTARDPAVVTYPTPLTVGSNGLELVLIELGDTPILSALSFKRVA